VPLEVRGRQLAVPVGINGQATALLLDTGAEKSFLTEATVERLRLPRDARFNTAIIGMGGGSARVDASVDHMQIGGASLPVDRISVNSLDGRMRFDGLIGLDLLRDFDLDLDTPQRMLTLYRVRSCERADPPWDVPALPIAGISTTTRWLKLPFEIDGVVGSAVLDTGATGTMINPRLARRLGLTEEAMANDRSLQLAVAAGEATPARVHRFRTLRIGPATIHDVALVVLTKEPPTLGGGRNFGDGVIGMDFVGTRRVWFSFGTDRLFVSHSDADGPATP